MAKRLINELYDNGVKGIEFSGGGEPTTHPDFEEVVSYASDLGCSLGLITNGLLLNRVYNVVDKFEFIRISLDAGDKDTYYKVHGVQEFEQVIDNIKGLTKFMNPIKIGIGFLIVEDNAKDIVKATKLVKDLKCRFIQFRPASLQDEIDIDIWAKAHEEVQKARQYSDTNFQVFDAGVKWRHLDDKRYYSKCYTSSLVAVVKANGDIPLCVLNRNNCNKYIGNVYDGGFFKHWYGERHKELIDSIKVQDCPKPCKHDSYNIAYEAYMNNLYNNNFI